MGAERQRVLLEALHPRGVPGRSVPGPVPPAAVPLPLLGVRRPARRPARVRPGGLAAAAVAAVRGRCGLPPGERGLLRPGRSGLLEPEQGSEGDDGVIERVVRWFDDRLGAASFARRSLRKVFPDHWSFMLGEIALYTFVIL